MSHIEMSLVTRTPDTKGALVTHIPDTKGTQREGS